MLIRTPADLGAAIRDKRRRVGLNQAQLAKRVGVSRQWVVDVEKGKQGSEVGLVFRTLSVLNMALQIAESRSEVGTKPQIDIDAIVKTARKTSK